MPIRTFNISFESSQNKQQYGTKITCTEVKGGGGRGGGRNWGLGYIALPKFPLNEVAKYLGAGWTQPRGRKSKRVLHPDCLHPYT